MISSGKTNIFQVSTLEDIANGVSSNVFTAGSNDALASLSTDVFDSICSQARSLDVTINWSPKEIVNMFVYQAGSKYKNKFGDIPTWFPNYDQWKSGDLEFFTYERRD